MKRWLIGSGALVLLLAAFFAGRAFPEIAGKDEAPVPDAAKVRRLVIDKHGDCGPEECRELTVRTELSGTQWFAVATYDGFYDDSVAAQRVRIPLVRKNEEWELDGPEEVSWRCGRMDSSPEFQTELCP